VSLLWQVVFLGQALIEVEILGLRYALYVSFDKALHDMESAYLSLDPLLPQWVTQGQPSSARHQHLHPPQYRKCLQILDTCNIIVLPKRSLNSLGEENLISGDDSAQSPSSSLGSPAESPDGVDILGSVSEE
jgi:hypothetical protein